MKKFLLALTASLALAGCSRLGEAPQGAAASAPAGAKAVARAPGAARHMAYEHGLNLELERDKLAAAHQALQDACRAAVDDQCVVLETRINTGGYASADLKLRARPQGIQKLLALLTTQGKVVNQSLKAEDLAAPLDDTAKKLEMLNDYRSRLEGLRGKAGSEVDALIKLNKELAQVQSDIEAMAGTRATLVQRVETEVLHVSMSAPQDRSFWRPVSTALSDFGPSLSQGVATAITGVAYLLPWGIMLWVFAWIARKLWRRKRPSKAADRAAAD